MVVTAHYLWGHVSGCSGGVCGVVLAPALGYAEVREAEVASTIKNQVLRLNVAMEIPLKCRYSSPVITHAAKNFA